MTDRNLRLELWEAINRVVYASGGDPGNTSIARQIAVAEVERAIDALVKSEISFIRKERKL